MSTCALPCLVKKNINSASVLRCMYYKIYNRKRVEKVPDLSIGFRRDKLESGQRSLYCHSVRIVGQSAD